MNTPAPHVQQPVQLPVTTGMTRGGGSIKIVMDCKLSVGSPKRGPLEVELKRNDLTGIKQRSVYRRRGTREDKGGWAVARDSGRFKVATVSHLETQEE